MIRVVKDLIDIPSHLSQASTLAETQTAIATENGNLYASNYKHSTVKDKLSLIYKDKCAYCESDITQGAPLQVEHYRPKAKVDKKDLAAGEAHKGYYWLGNEWSNLLLACQKCNQQGAKGNRFPIEGNRLFTPTADPTHYFILHQTMLDEKPLLLNPELVDPIDHLELDQNGGLQGKSEQGRISIEIYNLNRDGLITRRLKIIQEFVHRINKQLLERFDPSVSNPLTPNQFQRQMVIIFEDLIEGQLPHVEYSFVYISFLKQFDTLVLPHIDHAFQPEIKTAFQTFIHTFFP
jgi:hypothetical protein